MPRAPDNQLTSQPICSIRIKGNARRVSSNACTDFLIKFESYLGEGVRKREDTCANKFSEKYENNIDPPSDSFRRDVSVSFRDAAVKMKMSSVVLLFFLSPFTKQSIARFNRHSFALTTTAFAASLSLPSMSRYSLFFRLARRMTFFHSLFT